MSIMHADNARERTRMAHRAEAFRAVNEAIAEAGKSNTVTYTLKGDEIEFKADLIEFLRDQDYSVNANGNTITVSW